MLNICFTADHELFFGQNIADEERVFIAPSYRLMEVLEEYHIPLCLMTDVCSIRRYKELNIPGNYVDLMEEQLRYAITRGHDVQLHIHPHWLTSEYSNGCWQFNYDNYRLESFGYNQNDTNCVQNIIAEGKRYLVELLQPIDSDYNCIAYRAGGFCIQPEKQLLETLISENIKIDTSVYCGGYSYNNTELYDFKHVPNKSHWWVDPQRGLNYAANKAEGNLLEIAIGSYNFLPLISLKKLLYKAYKLKRLGQDESLRGSTYPVLETKLQQMTRKVQDFLVSPIMFSYDSASYKRLMDFIFYYLKRFDCINQEIYISLIGHPKTLTESSMKQVRKFCATVTNEHSDKVQFVRLRDIPT